jgi:DNA polymerase III delta' subunit
MSPRRSREEAAPAPAAPGIPALLPWQSGDWQRIGAVTAGGRLPHALLLLGDPGSGAVVLAEALAARLLCQQAITAGVPFAAACGACSACHLVAAGSHPDLFRLEPEEGHEQIRVDEARAAVEFAGLRAGQGGRKVVLIPQAERLNIQAANGLLKTLEEPPAGTVFLLTTHRPARLLVTVRSRCQRVPLAPPDAQQALDWLVAGGLPAAQARARLELTRGRPLAAVQEAAGEQAELHARLAESLEHLARAGQDAEGLWLAAAVEDGPGHDQLLPLLTLLCEDLLRLSLAGGEGHLAAPACAERLHRIAPLLSPATAGAWVSACYASAGRGLASGLKSDELLDTLSLAFRNALLRPL